MSTATRRGLEAPLHERFDDRAHEALEVEHQDGELLKLDLPEQAPGFAPSRA